MSNSMERLIDFFVQILNIPFPLSERIVDFFDVQVLERGEYLTKEGKYCQRMCVIDEGYLRFYTHSEKKVVTHWIFGRQQLVTDISSFFLNTPSKWNIPAISKTTLFSISHDRYQVMKRKVPEWNQFEMIFIVKLMSALENRIYTLISMSAEERYRHLLEENTDILNELPLQYIASMIGTTPETLSRIRRKLIS